MSKFEDYLPLYRQERLFDRIGVDLPRSSLSNWVLKCADLLLPLYKLLQSKIAEYDIASSDETTVQVLKEKDRPAQAKPILDKFHKWLIQHAPKVPPQSALGKAFGYTLNQWPKLQVYLKDGRLSFSNNHMECTVKPFVMGRKNWLFMNTPKGADAAAIIYSMIETAKAHEIKAYPYLKYVFEKIPTAETLEELEALLPFNVDQSQLDT